MRRDLQVRRLQAAVVMLGISIAATLVAERAGLIGPAQAQSEADRRKKEQEKEKHKATPPKQHQPPPPSLKPPPTPKFNAPPQSQGGPYQKPLPPSERPALRKELPPPDKQYGKPAPSFEKPKTMQPPPPVKPLAKPAPDLKPDPKNEGIKRPLPPPGPGQHFVVPPPKGPPELKKQPPSLVTPPPSDPKGPPELKKQPPSLVTPPPSDPKGPPELKKQPPSLATPPPSDPKGPPELKKQPPSLATPPPSDPKGPPVTVAPVPPPSGSPGSGAALKRVDDVKKFRVERVEEGGKRKIIEEPGKRFIVKEQGRTVVRHDEAERFLKRPGAKLDRRPDGSTETVYVRGDVRIVTVVDAHGRLLRRYRIDRDGRERNLVDSRRFYRGLAVGVGVGVLGIIALQLPPPRVTIPAEKYIVPYDDASDDDLYEALDAPPIEDLDRAYSLDEIRDNYELRARLRSVDIDTIQFDSGAWEVSPEHHGKLARIARAMLRVLERNSEAVFLVAGYTDAVGSEEDNASLSDRRAAAVAEVLTEQFDVPAENLVTQGYGEQFLKVDTQGPEPRNRRVSIFNITRLMAGR